MPAVRRVIRDAAAQDYRLSSFVLGVVGSPAFQMNTAVGRRDDRGARRRPMTRRARVAGSGV